MEPIRVFDASGFAVGDVVTFRAVPRWWVRLWRWVTRYKEPPPLVVTKVDYEAGEITVEARR